MSTATCEAAAAGIAGLFETLPHQLADLAKSDERVREWISRGLAAISEAANPTPMALALAEPASALVRSEVVDNLDERAPDQRQDLRNLLDVLHEIPRRLGQLRVGHIVDESSALNHAPGDPDGFVGAELRHESSPSLVGGTPSVGDDPDAGGDPARVGVTPKGDAS